MAYISVDRKDLNEWDQKTDTLFIFHCRNRCCNSIFVSHVILIHKKKQKHNKKQNKKFQFSIFHSDVQSLAIRFFGKNCPALTKIHASNHQHVVLMLYPENHNFIPSFLMRDILNYSAEV